MSGTYPVNAPRRLSVLAKWKLLGQGARIYRHPLVTAEIAGPSGF